MAITNLTDTKWKFNETIILDGSWTYVINFKSNNKNCVELANENPNFNYYDVDGECVWAYETDDWFDQAYRTIEITGGDDVTNSDLIAFLTANAVQITAPSFTRTKAAIKIYEDLNPEEYDALTKEPHAFYLVNGVGIYKGTTLISAGANSSMDEIVEELNQAIAAKQDTLVSGTNIKTINGESILGEGNIEVAASDDGVDTAYVEDEVLYIDDDTSAGSKVVVDLEEIPSIVDETSPDLINVNGIVYYKKEVTSNNITNLTGTKWYLNDILVSGVAVSNSIYVNFKSNNKNYISIYFEYNYSLNYYTDVDNDEGDFGLYVGTGDGGNNEWTNEAYRTIEITGGPDVENAELIEWLQENATLISTSYVYAQLSWTKEELEDTYVLNIDYDGTNYSKDVTKEELDNIKKHKYVRVVNSNHTIYYFTKISNDNDYTITYSSPGEVVNENLILGYDTQPDYYLMIYRTYITTSDEFENLVREVPTDASIIEDEGKLKLQLEHDGEVLTVNDTPNQFLQRNLDKPAFRWTDNDDTPLVDALNNIWGNVGKRLCFIVLENNSAFPNTSYPRIWCVAEWDGQVLHIRPLAPVPATLNGNVSLCQYLTITPSPTNITLDYIEGFKFADGSYASAYNLGNVSVDHIQLF